MVPNIAHPAGLTAEVPRPARFMASTQVVRLFLLLLLLLLVCVVGALLRAAARDAGTMNTLRMQGRTANARVFGKFTAHSSHYKSTTYYLDYRFDGGGVWVDGREIVRPDVYAQTQPGATFVVTYLPAAPQSYCVGAATLERVEADLYRGFWMGFVAFILLGLLLLRMEFNFRYHLFLLRGGSIAAATIAGLGKQALGKQETYNVTYQFTADGRRYQNKVACDGAFYNHGRPGQGLTVLYDPARPSRNIPSRMLTGVTLARPRH